jgi:hypothetical protein
VVGDVLGRDATETPTRKIDQLRPRFDEIWLCHRSIRSEPIDRVKVVHRAREILRGTPARNRKQIATLADGRCEVGTVSIELSRQTFEGLPQALHQGFDLGGRGHAAGHSERHATLTDQRSQVCGRVALRVRPKAGSADDRGPWLACAGPRFERKVMLH